MIAMRVGVHRRPHWPTAITCTFNRSEGAHYLSHLSRRSALRHTATPRKLYCAQPLRLAPNPLLVLRVENKINSLDGEN